MSDRGLTHVALPVSNLDTSLAFYEHYAQLRMVHQRTDTVGRVKAAWLSERTRPFVLVLIEACTVDHPLLPFAHLGVGCGSREDVDRRCHQARGEGCLRSGPTDSGYPIGAGRFLPTRMGKPANCPLAKRSRSQPLRPGKVRIAPGLNARPNCSGDVFFPVIGAYSSCDAELCKPRMTVSTTVSIKNRRLTNT